ncbi:hypothetical protein Cgig2_013122 [Carnegiea gigantea]|uniref:Ribosomal protein L19 n=1 Tax=Carnegiea gigantea TaxID=171969 RepID=A0A9Q1QP87_9CARY|nr:hypothetical protein Cgig2_013122 [Carnegiea gigantea]
MQSLIRALRSQCRISSEFTSSSSILPFRVSSSACDGVNLGNFVSNNTALGSSNFRSFWSVRKFGSFASVASGRKLSHESASAHGFGVPSLAVFNGGAEFTISHWSLVTAACRSRCFTTATSPIEPPSNDASAEEVDRPTRIKFKRPDKTARHIMQILDREAVEEVKAQREIPDIKPGYIVQLKLEVPENKRRITTIKGVVIARRNAGLNTTFRVRRLVAGVGVESLLPLYSPNIKEIKVLDKKKVRRAKLYYLRDKMNALKK